MVEAIQTELFERQGSWHEVGRVAKDARENTDQAFVDAGLNWEVEKVRLRGTASDDTAVSTNMNAIIRTGSNAVLGGCKTGYKLYQNEQAMEWCRPLVDSKLWDYDSVGSFQDGRFCWALLGRDEIELVPGDKLKNRLLFIWNHTAKRSNVVTPCTIRVFCSNTLLPEVNRQKGNAYFERVAHMSGMEMNMERLQVLWNKSKAAFDAQTKAYKGLLGDTFNDRKLRRLANKIFPIKKAGDKVTDRQAQNSVDVNRGARLMLMGGASGHKELGIQNTAYGAYMALTEYVEHYLGKKIKDRGSNILFGNGALLQRKIWEAVAA